MFYSRVRFLIGYFCDIDIVLIMAYYERLYTLKCCLIFRCILHKLFFYTSSYTHINSQHVISRRPFPSEKLSNDTLESTYPKQTSAIFMRLCYLECWLSCSYSLYPADSEPWQMPQLSPFISDNHSTMFHYQRRVTSTRNSTRFIAE